LTPPEVLGGQFVDEKEGGESFSFTALLYWY